MINGGSQLFLLLHSVGRVVVEQISGNHVYKESRYLFRIFSEYIINEEFITTGGTIGENKIRFLRFSFFFFL